MASTVQHKKNISEAATEYIELFEKQYGILLPYKEAEKQVAHLLAFYKALLPNELFEPDELDGNV